MCRFFLIFSILFFSACSSVEINTVGNESFYVGAYSQSDKEITQKKTVDFYFWGHVPVKDDVVLSELFDGQGIYNPSYINIKQYYSFSNIIASLLTLGLYMPVTFEVTLRSNEYLK